MREGLRRHACELVARDGFRRATIERLARSAGISKGAFYGFYPSKEALFLEILQETEGGLREEMAECIQAPGEPREVLGRVLRLLVEVLTRHPLLRVLTDPEESAVLFRGLPPSALEEAREEDDRWFGELFEELAARGMVDRQAIAVLTAIPRLFFAVFQGREWLGREFEAVTDTLVDALAGHLSRTADDPA